MFSGGTEKIPEETLKSVKRQEVNQTNLYF